MMLPLVLGLNAIKSKDKIMTLLLGEEWISVEFSLSMFSFEQYFTCFHVQKNNIFVVLYSYDNLKPFKLSRIWLKIK
jgi:hypothetical protein